MGELVQRIKQRGRQLGFDLVGMAPAREVPRWRQLCEWVHAGYAAGMTYVARRLEVYRHPEAILPGCRTVIVAAVSYRPSLARESLPWSALVASYARRRDYHEVIRERLAELVREVLKAFPAAQAKVVVDTAPLLERSFAVLAGLGWIGKNTMLIHPTLGSYTLLGAILTTAELPADPPFRKDLCGKCRACMVACPTGAIVAPRVLDARRCIAYWTIEAKELPPHHLRQLFGAWFFGCDICQQICPWNRKLLQGSSAPLTSWAAEEELSCVNACEVLTSSDEDLRRRFRHLPLWRARPSGLRRNAALVLGNFLRHLRRGSTSETLCQAAGGWQPDGNLWSLYPEEMPREEAPDTTDLLLRHVTSRGRPRPQTKNIVPDVTSLLQVLAAAGSHAEPAVRQAAVWALSCYPSQFVLSTLEHLCRIETNPEVRPELEIALQSIREETGGAGVSSP